MNMMKLAFRKRALLFFIIAVLVVVVVRLSQRTSETWVTYSPSSDASKIASDHKTILLWTPFFSKADYLGTMSQLGCPELRCLVTSNRSSLTRSDAVMFHVRDMDTRDLPAVRHPWQRWALLHHESPPHTPDIFKELEGKMNWTITYRLDSDIVLSPKVTKRKPQLPQTLTNYARNKTRMVVWFVSNCNTPSNREAYVKQLQKTLSIDIIGTCGGKECVPKMSPKCYQDAAAEYRFYLSFENSICKDYITEKFYHVLSHNFVPVVLGGADYTKMAPPGSYVNALDFESPRGLAKHLLELAKDESKYNEYFKWRSEYELKSEHYACELCRKLHDDTEPAKVWKSLHSWWFTEAGCRNWQP